MSPSFRLMLGEGSHPIEIVGTNKEFVPCFVEPRLSSQVSQDFSRVPVFLAFRWRRKNFDHVDFPQSADQAEKTHVSDISSRPGGPVHASLRHPVQPCPDPRRRPRPSGGAAILDPHGEAVFGHRDHFARIARHPVFLIRSTQDCHARLILSSGLGRRLGDAIFALCVVASASPPM